MEAIDDEWIQMGCKQMELYDHNPTAYTSLLAKSFPLREIMCRVYVSALKWKLADPLEKLPEAERRRIWDAAKAEAGGRINNEECIKLAKALYTINCFLNQ